MGEKFNADQEEAAMIGRMVNAWTAAQTVVEQLQPIMQNLGLLKPGGGLEVDRILAIHKKAHGEQ